MEGDEDREQPGALECRALLGFSWTPRSGERARTVSKTAGFLGPVMGAKKAPAAGEGWQARSGLQATASPPGLLGSRPKGPPT